MIETGVIHGRFQVLHNDHLKYLIAGKERCEHLIIGITNPDPTLTREDPADIQRSDPLANPLTYFERYTMVCRAMVDNAVSYIDFSVVPFPINLPELYKYYVPLDATYFLTIYDEWGRRKLKQFQDLGLKTEVLWTKSSEEKGLVGSDIRRRMVEGKAWQDLVSPSTRDLMVKWSIPDRLRRMHRL